MSNATAGNATAPECASDMDCSLFEICFHNVSWGQSEAFCGCNTWWSFQGEQCEERGVGAFLLLAAGIVQLLLAAPQLLVALWDIARLVQVFRCAKMTNAASTTLIFTAISLVFYVMWKAFYLAEGFAPWTEATTEFNEAGEIQSVYGLGSAVSIFGTQTFTFLACLNVSVLWLEVSQRARKMSPQMANNVSRYRRVCAVTGGLFAILMGGAAAADRLDLGLVVGLPLLMILGIVFLVGRVRMLGLLGEALSVASSEPSSDKAVRGNKTAAQRTARTMRAIRVCSRRVLTGLLITVVGGLVYAYLLNFNGGWVETAPVGSVPLTPMIGETMAFGMLYLLTSIFLYSHRSATKIYRRELESNLSNTPSKGTGTLSDGPEGGSSFAL